MFYKIINDPLYGSIEFSEISIQIIDTPEFQRLRNIKQVGVCSYVFPSANHSRFEHSLGVSHLAKELAQHLHKNQPELNISDNDILCLEIAGLCHDLGHGPFSHLFDDYFLKNNPNINNIINKNHEIRSINLFKYIIHKYDINISTDSINKIINMITPSVNDNFIYQIVSNKKSGLDVDKMDYIFRDTFNSGLKFSIDINRLIKNSRILDNDLHFNIKEAYNINELFNARYRLHKQFYNNAKVKAIELLIIDILHKLDSHLNISNNIDNHEFYCKLDDNIIYIYKWFNNMDDVKHLVFKLETRNIPKLIFENNIPISSNNNFIINDFQHTIKNYSNSINDNKNLKIIEQNIIISLNGNLSQHPINNILFYDNKNIDLRKHINKEDISILVNNYVGEIIIRKFKI